MDKKIGCKYVETYKVGEFAYCEYQIWHYCTSHRGGRCATHVVQEWKQGKPEDKTMIIQCRDCGAEIARDFLILALKLQGVKGDM